MGGQNSKVRTADEWTRKFGLNVANTPIAIPEASAIDLWDHQAKGLGLSTEADMTQEQFLSLMETSAESLVDIIHAQVEPALSDRAKTLKGKAALQKQERQIAQWKRSLRDAITSPRSRAYFLRAAQVPPQAPITKHSFITTLAAGGKFKSGADGQGIGEFVWALYNVYRPTIVNEEGGATAPSLASSTSQPQRHSTSERKQVPPPSQSSSEFFSSSPMQQMRHKSMAVHGDPSTTSSSTSSATTELHRRSRDAFLNRIQPMFTSMDILSARKLSVRTQLPDLIHRWYIPSEEELDMVIKHIDKDTMITVEQILTALKTPSLKRMEVSLEYEALIRAAFSDLDIRTNKAANPPSSPVGNGRRATLLETVTGQRRNSLLGDAQNSAGSGTAVVEALGKIKWEYLRDFLRATLPIPLAVETAFKDSVESDKGEFTILQVLEGYKKVDALLPGLFSSVAGRHQALMSDGIRIVRLPLCDAEEKKPPLSPTAAIPADATSSIKLDTVQVATGENETGSGYSSPLSSGYSSPHSQSPRGDEAPQYDQM